MIVTPLRWSWRQDSNRAGFCFACRRRRHFCLIRASNLAKLDDRAGPFGAGSRRARGAGERTRKIVAAIPHRTTCDRRTRHLAVGPCVTGCVLETLVARKPWPVRSGWTGESSRSRRVSRSPEALILRTCARAARIADRDRKRLRREGVIREGSRSHWFQLRSRVETALAWC